MEIKYLKYLQEKIFENPELFEGVSEEDILQLEMKLEKVFPTIYREFLYLCGKKNIMFYNLIKFNSLPDNNNYFKEQLGSFKKQFDQKNGCWAFSCVNDGVDSYEFFYFEDPEMELYYVDTTNYDEFLENDICTVFTKIGMDFKELINSKIKQYEYDEWKRNWRKRK